MEPASISLTEPTSPPSRARAAAAATTPGASSILTFWLSPERAEPTQDEALAILREAASKSALTVAELRRFLAAHTTSGAATDAVRATVAWRAAHPELDDVPQLLPLLTDCVASVARGVYHLRPRAPQLEALSAGVTAEELAAHAIAGFEALRRELVERELDGDADADIVLLLDLRDVDGGLRRC